MKTTRPPKRLTTVEIIPYGFRLLLVQNKEDWAKLLSKHGLTSDIDLNLCDGQMALSVPYVFVGVFNSSFATLSHELSHVCIDVLECIGIEITGKTSEAFCYLMAHLVAEVLRQNPGIFG